MQECSVKHFTVYLVINQIYFSAQSFRLIYLVENLMGVQTVGLVILTWSLSFAPIMQAHIVIITLWTNQVKELLIVQYSIFVSRIMIKSYPLLHFDSGYDETIWKFELVCHAMHVVHHAQTTCNNTFHLRSQADCSYSLFSFCPPLLLLLHALASSLMKLLELESCLNSRIVLPYLSSVAVTGLS